VQWTSLSINEEVPLNSQASLISHQGALFATNSQSADVISYQQAENSTNKQTIKHQLTGLSAIENSISYAAGIIAIDQSNDSTNVTSVALLQWQNSQQFNQLSLPSIPLAFTHSTLSLIDNMLYALVTDSGQHYHFYQLNLAPLRSEPITQESINHQLTSWQSLPAPEFLAGMELFSAVQNDGFGKKVYVLTSGLNLVQFDPALNIWISQPPLPMTGSTVSGFSPAGQSHIFTLHSDGSGFTFNAITKQWTQYSQQGHDTSALLTKMVAHGDNYVALVADKGKHQVWQVALVGQAKNFGWINMTVLIVYLLLVVLVGVYFMFKNRNTDDYFRGGQNIPWWAAACSIYATMLSSLTYVALPAIVYQTNWLLLVGTWMIILVAPIAIYVAMPFFRQIDATSAYEYLSKRFNMSVRLFASALFTLFHIGRMGIVMALTALALAAVTPLTAGESVLLMGVLCLIYCTLGGIEAVIWTDTLQTVVLLIGAVLCFITILSGIDGGFSTYLEVATSDNKMTILNLDFSSDSMLSLSLWVIIIGGIGQNLSSYTADQAVVQRYMVTSDVVAAKKSIWANALIAGPSALLFFAIGTGLYVFYQGHPEKLDPSMRIDQIFPAFIATELPVGIAGLIVAGIFAAAQSTVSTSMNSIATTLVTDFIRPFSLVNTEKGYMSAARWLTFLMGTLGTLAGLIFIDPEIRSLMNAYFKVIGMFMGALGGLFVLGVLSKRANATGAMTGLLAGVAMMLWAWQAGWANGYLYATIGIISCLAVGYLVSLVKPNDKDIDGLTLRTMRKA